MLSRVVTVCHFQGKGERNFHIFYYLLDGLSQRELAKYHLAGDVVDFAYVNGGVTPYRK